MTPPEENKAPALPWALAGLRWLSQLLQMKKSLGARINSLLLLQSHKPIGQVVPEQNSLFGEDGEPLAFRFVFHDGFLCSTASSLHNSIFQAKQMSSWKLCMAGCSVGMSSLPPAPLPRCRCFRLVLRPSFSAVFCLLLQLPGSIFQQAMD